MTLPMILHGPWSHSRATACALALYKDKVLNAPPEPRPDRLMAIDRRNFGHLLHGGADEMLGSVITNGTWPNIEDLGHRLLLKYPELIDMTPEVMRRLELYRRVFRVEKGMDEVERDALLRTRMIGHEMRLAVDADGSPCSFTDCPPTGWRGIIDYAEDEGEGRLLILDNKNQPYVFKDHELRDHEQLSGYLDLVLKHYPGQFQAPYRVGIYYLEFGYTQIVEIDDEQLQKNLSRLRARALQKESLAKDEIGPEPGFGKCQYCDYLASCPSGKELMTGGELVPTDEGQARELGARVMVWEEKVKQARDALRAYTAEHGPVVLDDQTFIGHSLSRTGVKYDKDKTLRALKGLIASGVVSGRLSQFTSLNLAAVKAAAKSEEVDEVLAKTREPTNKPEFKFFRPKKAEGVKTKKKGRKTVVDREPRKTKTQVKRRKT